jgi:putative ABC transport system substrate-binding protein
MRRREFIALAGGVAAWPGAGRTQQAGVPVVGYLVGSAPDAPWLTGFRESLKNAGYVEGQNIAFEGRAAEGQYNKLPSLASELVRRPVAVIVAFSLPALVAAKAATATIPIVFVSGGDPVQLGFVASLNRPGANITGVSFLGVDLAAKRLELLLELAPQASVIGVLENPANPRTDPEIAEVRAAARGIGKEILVGNASSERDFNAAFATLVQGRASAVLVSGDPLFALRRDQIIALAAQHAMPAIYEFREFTAGGGLLSYGLSLTDTFRLVAGQVARILQGAKPGDLPILQPTRFELVINLKTAKALRLTIPPTLLARTDEVIE